MRTRFEQGISSEELYDMIDEIADWSNGAYNLISALEEYFGGEIAEASSGASHAISINNLVPMPGKKYDGLDEEYHHIAFMVDGDIRVEAVPFTTKERINEMGIKF